MWLPEQPSDDGRQQSQRVTQHKMQRIGAPERKPENSQLRQLYQRWRQPRCNERAQWSKLWDEQESQQHCQCQREPLDDDNHALLAKDIEGRLVEAAPSNARSNVQCQEELQERANRSIVLFIEQRHNSLSMQHREDEQWQPKHCLHF